MKLVTVKEYAKTEAISETAVRKRVASKLCQSTQVDDLTYIIIEDKSPVIIKDLKQKIKLLNSNIKTLKIEARAVERQTNYVDKLEARVEHLEVKLEESTNKKEELYEKVINTIALPR